MTTYYLYLESGYIFTELEVLNMSPTQRAALTPVHTFETITSLLELGGKTIASAQQLKHRDYDDEGFLLLTFTDESQVVIASSYSQYTGKSRDEYPTFIKLLPHALDLIPL